MSTLPLSSSRSSERSRESSIDTKSVQPPRNAQRLSRTNSSTTTTPLVSSTAPALGPPLELEFKIPSLPRPVPSERLTRESSGPRSPLTMSEHINIPPSPIDASISASTPNRLKRLSLVARPPSLAVSPEIPDALNSPRLSHQQRPDSLRTPRGTRMRSSISYSPAPVMHTPRSAGALERLSWDLQRASSTSTDAGGKPSVNGGTGSPLPAAVKGETWSDKHSDLLQSIAEKQRRIIELKQELQMEQNALYSLKGRWALLVNSSFSPPPTSSSSTYPPAVADTSSHRTTDSTPTTQTDDQWTRLSGEVDRSTTEATSGPGIHSLLDDVLGNTPLVDPSVVEGGRRFIGNLMRTVGAAAGGTVPAASVGGEQDGKDASTHGAGGMDLSGIRGMFSWSSAPPKSSTVRIRPPDLPRIASTPSRTPTPPVSSS